MLYEFYISENPGCQNRLNQRLSEVPFLFFLDEYTYIKKQTIQGLLSESKLIVDEDDMNSSGMTGEPCNQELAADCIR